MDNTQCKALSVYNAALLSMSDIELLKEYKRTADAVIASKDEELWYLSKYPNRDMWDQYNESDYDAILLSLQCSESTLRDINNEIKSRGIIV